MLFMFCYVFLYCNIDGLLNRFYLPLFDMGYNDTYNLPISDKPDFFYSLTTISKFILSVYGYYIFYYLFVSKIHNINSLALALYTPNIFYTYL